MRYSTLRHVNGAVIEHNVNSFVLLCCSLSVPFYSMLFADLCWAYMRVFCRHKNIKFFACYEDS